MNTILLFLNIVLATINVYLFFRNRNVSKYDAERNYNLFQIKIEDLKAKQAKEIALGSQSESVEDMEARHERD